MRTTTTIWKFKEHALDDEVEKAKFLSNRNALYAAAAEIAGNNDLYKEPISAGVSEDGLFFTTVRAWPDLAAAEAWVAFCISKNTTDLDNSLVSSVVDPE